MLIWFLIKWRHDFDMRLTEKLKYACNVNYVGEIFSSDVFKYLKITLEETF